MTLTVHRATVTLDDGRLLVAEDWPTSGETMEAIYLAHELLTTDPWESRFYTAPKVRKVVISRFKADTSRPFGFNIMIEPEK